MTATTGVGIAPVLFLVFNRPETTARVFEAIRAARPSQLFVAADGPRADRDGEVERCRQVREIATVVDWPCTVTTQFREGNLGCKRAVSSAIDWFFAHVPDGVILEDDCVPDASFFEYASALLERYRDDTRVMSISGDNFIAGHWRPESSYYFSAFTHIWGWASWRRAWGLYDVEMSDWPAQREGGFLRRKFPESPDSQAYWAAAFDRVSRGEIDTWDYQWAYATFKHGGVSCMPAVNLISNIGFGADATHTRNPEAKLANLPSTALPFPLTHPSEVVVDQAADGWTAQHVFDIGSGSVTGNVRRRNRRRHGRVRRGLASRFRRLLQAAGLSRD
jgi:hypothetical protein